IACTTILNIDGHYVAVSSAGGRPVDAATTTLESGVVSSGGSAGDGSGGITVVGGGGANMGAGGGGVQGRGGGVARGGGRRGGGEWRGHVRRYDRRGWRGHGRIGGGRPGLQSEHEHLYGGRKVLRQPRVERERVLPAVPAGRLQLERLHALLEHGAGERNAGL